MGDVVAFADKKSCYQSHPALVLGEFKVYGGSCLYPIVKDADIYVGLADSMEANTMSFPWVEGHAFFYSIRDRKAPVNAENFVAMVDWLVEQIKAGKKVHAGCFGGHGRTGLLLSALVSRLTEEEDAIGYVRKNYCTKAVESPTQVKFLVEHFGVKKVGGSDSGKYRSGKKTYHEAENLDDLPVITGGGLTRIVGPGNRKTVYETPAPGTGGSIWDT